MSDNEKLAEIYGKLKSKAAWHQALSIVGLCCVSLTLTFALVSATAHILFSERLLSWTISFQHLVQTWSPLLLVFMSILLALLCIKNYFYQQR